MQEGTWTGIRPAPSVAVDQHGRRGARGPTTSDTGVRRGRRDVPPEEWDVVLVGAGVMSATLGVLLRELQPDWRIVVVERLDQAGLESSSAWNNAGTGHAGLCEFNYTPRRPDGSVDVSSAVRIGEQFLTSLQFWAGLTERA